MKIKEASAHCDIPCKIYDPIVIQIAALTVVRIIDIIEEKNLDTSKPEDSSELSRLTLEKENQARIVKDETRIIWGDYFKDPQIEAFPNVHEVVHSIMMQGSKCKQSLERGNAEKLVELVNNFSEIFWKTKNIETSRVTAPYPPALEMVVPKLQMPEKFRIKGSSMNPTYKDGDIVEIDSFPNYFKDDVVVLKMPELGYVIKRIEGFNRGLIILRGDNKKLHSSVCDQLHRKQDIFGKVVS